VIQLKTASISAGFIIYISAASAIYLK